MSPKWLTSLVRARQAQEDVARQNLAEARRLTGMARLEAERQGEYIDDLCEAVDTQYTASAFVAAAVALQSAAATHSAAVFARGQAELTETHRTDALRHAAVARGAAEKLSERADAVERLALARVAQRELDEAGARVHRDADARAGAS